MIVYKTKINGKYVDVIRFDCSHGIFHKHIFYEMKERKEIIYSELNGKLINEIIEDIEKNFNEYKRMFLAKVEKNEEI